MDYRDAEVLERLYWDKDLTLEEMAEKLDTSAGTISKWMSKLDVETNDKGRGRKGIDYCSFHTRKEGYEVVNGGHGKDVLIHRLIAIAEGFDIQGKEIHHKNGIKWDNRPDNLEVLSHQEHIEKHDCIITN